MLHYHHNPSEKTTPLPEEHTPRFTVEPEEAEPENTASVDPEEIAMHALIRRIGRRSLLEKSVLAQLGNRHLPTPTVRSLVTLLQGPFAERWRERLAAIWALGRMELAPGHRVAVAAALEDALTNGHVRSDACLNERGRNAWSRAIPPAIVLGGAAGFWAVKDLMPSLSDGLFGVIHSLLVMLVTGGLVGLITTLYSTFLLFPLVLPLSYALDSARNQRVRVEAAHSLGRLRLPESVGALARTSLDLSQSVRSAAEEALRATLPTLTPDHFGRLDFQTVSHLCRLLNVRRHQLFFDAERTEDLVVDLLIALGKVGDSRTVDLVTSIMEEGWTERVRNTAREVLPILQERRRREQDHKWLLRGASAPREPHYLLLRLVEQGEDPTPETLLRPTAEEKQIC